MISTIFKNLTYLNLARNLIHSLPKNVFRHLTNLKVLDVSHNQIQTIDSGCFTGLKLLHFLSLDFNRILQVPQNVFEEVHNLKSLHLEYNHINYLNESSFNGLQGSLELLSLSGNFLRNVPTKALQSMENLLILYLNNNAIDRIREDSFVNFGQNLTDLWLQNNGLIKLDANAFEPMKNIKWIKLFNNQLKSLDLNLTDLVLETITCLDIHNNPLYCSCELFQWITQDFVSKNCHNPLKGQNPKKYIHCFGKNNQTKHNILEEDLCPTYTPKEESQQPKASSASTTCLQGQLATVLLYCILKK